MKDLIRQETRDGVELVEFMLKVLRGEIKAPVKYQMEAARWLAERGFGKAEPSEGIPLLISVQGIQVPGVQALPPGQVVDVEGKVHGAEGSEG